MEIKLSKETALLAEALIELRKSFEKCLDAVEPTEFWAGKDYVSKAQDGLIECFCNSQSIILDIMKDGIANNPKSADNEL